MIARKICSSVSEIYTWPWFSGIPASNGMPGLPGVLGPQGPQGREGKKGQIGDKGSQGNCLVQVETEGARGLM